MISFLGRVFLVSSFIRRIWPLPLSICSCLIASMSGYGAIFSRPASAAVIPRRVIYDLLKTTILPTWHKSRDIRRDLAITRTATLNLSPLATIRELRASIISRRFCVSLVRAGLGWRS